MIQISVTSPLEKYSCSWSICVRKKATLFNDRPSDFFAPTQILLPCGLIHLKTDSPDLYHFTKKVIALYGCVIHSDLDDAYNQDAGNQDLAIKTHYESLDIAGSNRIHYISFSLPENLPGKEMDEELKKSLQLDEKPD